MKNSAAKKSRTVRTEPAILSIFHKAELEHRQIEEMFELLGWSNLPEELKLCIEEDVKGFVDELHGQYCTNCSYVQRRRESVDFWVNSFLNELCSLNTAVQALKVKNL